MSLLPQSRSSLLRLLMILEWVLLGIVAIAQILVTLVNTMPILLIANGLGLGIFAGFSWQSAFSDLPFTPSNLAI